MTTNEESLSDSGLPPLHPAIHELDIARGDLTRLSVLLSEAFGELLNSFGGVRAIALAHGNMTELDSLAGRAIIALQCEDLAGQMIGFTQKRLTLARESLKNCSPMPQTCLTNVAWPIALASAGGLVPVSPVQQHAMHAGSIELF